MVDAFNRVRNQPKRGLVVSVPWSPHVGYFKGVVSEWFLIDYVLLAVLCFTVASGIRLLLADVCTVLGAAVPPFALEMVDPGTSVKPNYDIVRAVFLCPILC